MAERLTNPTNADLDAALRRAHARKDLFHVPGDDPDEAPAEPEAPKPGPLAGGAAESSPGHAPIDGNKWLRALVDSSRTGAPMPPWYHLTKDA